jgi:hypothetical protein
MGKKLSRARSKPPERVAAGKIAYATDRGHGSALNNSEVN